MFGKILFYFAAVIDIIALCVVGWMMLDDTLKGRTATNNPTLFGLTMLVAALVAIGFWLKSRDNIAAGIILVGIPAVPLFLYGLFVLMFIILKPDMK